LNTEQERLFANLKELEKSKELKWINERIKFKFTSKVNKGTSIIRRIRKRKIQRDKFKDTKWFYSIKNELQSR
jgi:hypothetical protein